jgi:hypothetical protein
MLLVVEFVLTVFACIHLHKVGRSWALGLIPMGLTALFGFCLGAVGVYDIGIIMLLDFACVAVLVGLFFVKGK